MLGQPLLGLFLGHVLKECPGHSLAGKFSRFSIEVSAKVTNNVFLSFGLLFPIHTTTKSFSIWNLLLTLVLTFFSCCFLCENVIPLLSRRFELRLDFVTQFERKDLYFMVVLI